MNTVSFLTDLSFGSTPQIKVMHESTLGKEIRICMDKDNVMKSHKAPAAITIMVLKGAVRIDSEEEDCVLGEGEMVYFEANVPHSLQAHEQSVIRLTLSRNDSAKRVINLLKPQ